MNVPEQMLWSIVLGHHGVLGWAAQQPVGVALNKDKELFLCQQRMEELSAQEVIMKDKIVIPNAVPITVNGIIGRVGNLVLPRVTQEAR